jgi:hypothetical protein
MPQVSHIKKARQRFKMVPVLDEDGKQKEVIVNGRTRRHGGEITRKLTVADKDQPLPQPTCDYCRKEIAVGMPYKVLSVRQQYGGRSYERHEACPNWQPWEYSSSLSARIAQVQSNEIDASSLEGDEDAQALAEEVASWVRELADEKQESLDNMPDGLRDSSELSEQVDALSSWADEVESVSLPEVPSSECQECEGTGSIGEGDEAKDCEQCGGEGTVEPSDEEMDAWRDEVQSELAGALENAPL